MKDYQKKPWSHSDRNLLRNHYYFKTEEELLEMFPDRSINSIRKQVHYLKNVGGVSSEKELFNGKEEKNG